jgi:excisionase family DNA binding protein
MFNKYPDIWGISDLCSALNIGRNKAYDLIKTGEIKSMRIGKTHKIAKSWVEDYLNKDLKISENYDIIESSNRLLVNEKEVHL